MKRTRAEEQSDSSDDIGPKPIGTNKKTMKFEKFYLDMLPSCDLYENSYMHQGVLNHVLVTPVTDYILTSSVEGHFKFWKKDPEGIVFAKHFHAHIGEIRSIACTDDGSLAASVGVDKTIKFYDVINFDMIRILSIDYEPDHCCWFTNSETGNHMLLVSSEEEPFLRVYDYLSTDRNNDTGIDLPLTAVEKIHKTAIVLMKYNHHYNTIISIDGRGMMEYWNPSTGEVDIAGCVFSFKGDTDLYEFFFSKIQPTSLEISPNGQYFSVMGKDKIVRIFEFLTGKLIAKYDESPEVYKAQQEENRSIDSLDFGRRITLEKRLDKSYSSGEIVPQTNVIFDQSSNFIMYSTMIGIKLVNFKEDRLITVLGLAEQTDRFLSLSLYQGRTTGSVTMGNLNINAQVDPTIFALAYNTNRFYLFSKREPIDLETRDIINELVLDEIKKKQKEEDKKRAKRAIIHTTLGDIHIKLFKNKAPLAVENFTVHASEGYYNKHIFHRVIKSFMIQTGDPTGTGTGGESIWGKHFVDEFSDLSHETPFTVSMANAGPNTNSSQFFITIVPLPHLDTKHTIFGRVIHGIEIVKLIENVKTEQKSDYRKDKPLEDISIVNIDVFF